MKTFEDYNNEMFNKMLATDFELNGEKQAMINMLNNLSKKQEELERKLDFVIEHAGTGCVQSGRLKQLFNN